MDIKEFAARSAMDSWKDEIERTKAARRRSENRELARSASG